MRACVRDAVFREITYYASYLLQGRLDVRDAASSTFLTEVAATLKDLQSLCGTDFLVYLQSSALPATKLPSNAQVRHANALSLTAMKRVLSLPQNVGC